MESSTETKNEFIESVKSFSLNYYTNSSKFLRKHGHNLILLMATVTFIFQFFPLFSPDFQSNVNDDYAYNDTFSYLFILGNMALLMVCILPGIDLILDCLAPFTSSSYSAYFRPQVAEKAKDEANELAAKTTRLSKIERAMFLIGVMCSAISIFPAYNNASPKQGYFLYNAFENNNSVFTLLPIVSFLCRSTTTWTPLITLTISACVCISDLTSTMAYIYIYQSPEFNNLVHVSPIMMLLASSIYVVTMFASAYNTYVWHMSKSKKISGAEDSLGAMDLLNEEHIHIATVAAQSFTTLIDFGINSYWYYMLTLAPLTLDQTGTIFLAMAASNCLTFLIEFRVRKSEVSTTLYALLDSKKSYVRYISHELRTPMNVALLGVALSRTDVKENADPDWGDGVVETLEDVELACSTAVNILNDLLSFEKMESGILELHKEPIVVLSFISDCVRIFSMQAREKGVILKVDLTMTDDDIEKGLYPVLPSDVVMGDRFKLEQVLRNLVSNALKFSPAGSTVTLGALYRPPTTTASIKAKSLTVGSTPAGSKKVSSRFTKAFQSIGSFTSGRTAASTSGEDTFDGDIKVVSMSRKAIQLMALGNLIIRCVDQGAGISEENQAKLFRGVVQFSPEKLQAGGGSGFGMFISKGIIELHKGVMNVYSKGEGFGSTFSMEIPMQRTSPSFGANLALEESESTCGETRVHRDSNCVLIELSEVNEDRDSEIDSNFHNPKSVISESDDLIGIAPTDDSENKEDEENTRGMDVGVLSVEPPLFSTADATTEPPAFTTTTATATATATAGVVAAKTPKVSNGPQHSILVVDDSGMNRKMMVKSMVAKGHICEEAEDGLIALEKVKARHALGTSYDIILMDFIMPNMDGPSASKAIRVSGIKTPIFGLTGNCMQRDIDWFTECGADHVLAKPINMKEFDRKVEEYLKK